MAALPRQVCFLLFTCPAVCFLAATVNEKLCQQMTTVIILTLFQYFQVVLTGLDWTMVTRGNAGKVVDNFDSCAPDTD